MLVIELVKKGSLIDGRRSTRGLYPGGRGGRGVGLNRIILYVDRLHARTCGNLIIDNFRSRLAIAICVFYICIHLVYICLRQYIYIFGKTAFKAFRK